jgi:hypothetical protein
MRVRFLMVLASVVALGACDDPSLSIRPTYSDSQLTWDPALVGQWESEDDTVTIERISFFRYKLDLPEEGLFAGYLYRVGDDTLFDLTPLDRDLSALKIPVHLWGRVLVRSDTLWFAYLTVARWAKIAEAHPSLFTMSPDLPPLGAMPPESLAALAQAEILDTADVWRESHLQRVSLLPPKKRRGAHS